LDTNLSANIVSGLDAFNEDYAQAKASTGGAQRPPKGEWDNTVSSINVTTEDVKMRIGKSEEIPAFAVDFKYKLLGGSSSLPNEMKQGQEWPGRRFIFPTCGIHKMPAGVTEGKKTQLRIQLERLKGHLTTLLGAAYTGNLPADIQKAIQLVSNKDAIIAVRVNCTYRTKEDDTSDEGTTYFDEYLMRRLS